MKIYPGSSVNQLAQASHPVFQAVEKEFDYWFNNQPTWRRGPYQGWGEDEPVVCNKSGAIQDAIEALVDEADETGKPVVLAAFDLMAHFEP